MRIFFLMLFVLPLLCHSEGSRPVSCENWERGLSTSSGFVFFRFSGVNNLIASKKSFRELSLPSGGLEDICTGAGSELLALQSREGRIWRLDSVGNVLSSYLLPDSLLPLTAGENRILRVPGRGLYLYQREPGLLMLFSGLSGLQRSSVSLKMKGAFDALLFREGRLYLLGRKKSISFSAFLTDRRSEKTELQVIECPEPL